MARSKTTSDLFQKKKNVCVAFTHPAFQSTIGNAERKGCWVVYGHEKNGKTRFALKLAKEIAIHERVAYISAEEGLDDSFMGAVRCAGITASDDILWDEYLSVSEIVEKFQKQRSSNIIVIDNLTMYSDEMKPTEIKKKLLDALPSKLIIFVAHEERKEAYPAIARMAKKLAKVIFHIEGLKAFVTSRFSPGGEIIINEEKSEIYHGSSI
jgi:adenosyl cobinamide kinase/adenosyl cobinamide phosphate guanylyltransferase